MHRTILLAAIFAVELTGTAIAGDTVTVNLPGGATQTVSTGTIAGIINEVGGTIPVGDNGGDSIIASVSLNPATGEVTITSVGGATYSMTSLFIARLLLSYL